MIKVMIRVEFVEKSPLKALRYCAEWEDSGGESDIIKIMLNIKSS